MRTTITLRDLTAEKIENEEYKDSIPEFYTLTSVVENIPWHLNQSVFNHLVSSFKAMTDIINGEVINDLSPESVKSIRNYLNEDIDSLPISELLKLAALLHDVGKDKTIQHLPNGSTICPGHEAESANRIPEYARVFGLTEDQEKFLHQLVANHDYVHQAVAKTRESDSADENIKLLKEQLGEKYIAICLLSLADMQGGDLRKSNPEEFEKYQEILKYFLEH